MKLNFKIILIFILTTSCNGPGFLAQQSTAVEDVNSIISDLGNGVMQTQIYATEDSSQVVTIEDSGSLNGTSIVIAPGPYRYQQA